MKDMKAIVIKDLTKQFNGTTADDNISFDVEKGEIFGLLGPNGAGKSTLMSMLCTMLKPSSGTAEVNGYDIARQPNEVRGSIGIVFQDPSLDDRLTGRENLEMHAMLYGVPKDARRKRIDGVLDLVELTDRANDMVRTYSGGMRRRLEIARGLIHYPKVLFLDEPTIGLDPQTREHIWNYITELARTEKITIVLTTHYMEEAEMLCNRIAIIDNGRIIALGTPSQLKKSVGGDTIIITVSDLEKAKAAFPEAKVVGGKLAISVKSAEMEIKKVFDKAAKAGVDILEANMRRPTLNDVFLKLTGKEIREERADSKSQMKDHARGMGMMRR